MHRFALTVLGLPQGERWWRWWPSKAAESSGWDNGQWALWLWQLLWALAFGAGLVQLTWSRLAWEEDNAELSVNRVVLALCSVLSFPSALLLAHSILARRSLPTRVYYLHRNSRTPHLALRAIDRTLFTDLTAFAVLAIAGLHIDAMRAFPTLVPVTAAGYDGVVVRGRELTALLCLAVLRLHFVAALSLFASLLAVHALRVQQATTEVRAPHCNEEGVTAQLVDVDLALHDSSCRLGWKAAVILTCSCTEAAVRWVELARHEGDERSASAALLSFCYSCVLVGYVMWPIARLNAASARLQSAVALFPLFRAAYSRPIACPELRFDLVGVHIGYSAVASFVLVTTVALLWVTQREAGMADP